MRKSNFAWEEVIWRNHFDSPENIVVLDVRGCGQNRGQILYPLCTAPITIKTSFKI